MSIKTAKELAQAALNLAKNYKTLYVLGCIGYPMTDANKATFLTKHCAEFNSRATRKPKIQAASADTFGFDCVCMIKALLWDWKGNLNKSRGGAVYGSNGVPDIGADQMINVCTDVSTDFSNIQVGEVVWIKGHVGLYVGDGLVVECTYRWKDGVQITAIHNLGKKSGYNGRSWTKHGKLPYISYNTTAAPVAPNKPEPDYVLGMRILREGCEGEDVRALQILLKGKGYDLGIAGPNKDGIDGKYGPKTKAAVTSYQHDEHLTEDGVAGINTMSRIMGIK